MESESPSRRRKYSNVNRKNVVIEKKYETEIRRYDKETADMLCGHLHNTIQLMNTIKQVKRNSGQADPDAKQIPTPSDTGNIHDLARNATNWFYCTNYTCDDWDELANSDFWRKNKRPVTADQNQTKSNAKMDHKKGGQRKVSTDRPKTATPLLYLRGQEKRTIPQQNSKNQRSLGKVTISFQQKKDNSKTININGKERIPLNINSKVFKLAHGMIKTPNLRRFCDRDSTISEETTSLTESDDESASAHPHLLKRRNSGFLSATDMHTEARKASRGSEEATALFRLAIERQRRLSVAPNEYSDWALKLGVTNFSDIGTNGGTNDDKSPISDELSNKDMSDGKFGSPSKILTRTHENESTSARSGNIDTKQRENLVKGRHSEESFTHLSNHKNDNFTSNVDAENEYINKVTGLSTISALPKIDTASTSAKSAVRKIEENKTHVQSDGRQSDKQSVKRPEIAGMKTAKEKISAFTRSESKTDLNKREDSQIEATKSRRPGVTVSPKIRSNIVPLAHSSTQALCQNVSVSTLNETRKIEEETDIFSSDNEDESVEDTPRDKANKSKENGKETDQETDMKKELELVDRRLQVSSFDTKKFAPKSYVKPHLRYKTERMYLLRRKNLLHRQIALASQDGGQSGTTLPWPDQRLGLQNRVVSSNRHWRQRELNKLINSNTTQQHVNKRNSMDAVPRERIEQFLQKVNQFIAKERNPALFI